SDSPVEKLHNASATMAAPWPYASALSTAQILVPGARQRRMIAAFCWRALREIRTRGWPSECLASMANRVHAGGCGGVGPIISLSDGPVYCLEKKSLRSLPAMAQEPPPIPPPPSGDQFPGDQPPILSPVVDQTIPVAPLAPLAPLDALPLDYVPPGYSGR